MTITGNTFWGPNQLFSEMVQRETSFQTTGRLKVKLCTTGLNRGQVLMSLTGLLHLQISTESRGGGGGLKRGMGVGGVVLSEVWGWEELS